MLESLESNNEFAGRTGNEGSQATRLRASPGRMAAWMVLGCLVCNAGDDGTVLIGRIGAVCDLW